MAEATKKICFVVSPLGEPDSSTRIHADWFLEEIVQPVFNEIPSFEVVRADKIALPGMIDAQVIQHLLDAEVVVADLSTLNPNVFYEIGIRHMIQRPIIHMQSADEKIPFDVSLYRAIRFSRTRPSDIRKAREDLRAAVKSVTANGYQVDNPVTRARGQIAIEIQGTPGQQVLAEQLRAVQQRLSLLESRTETKSSDAPPYDWNLSVSLTNPRNGRDVETVMNALHQTIGSRLRATVQREPGDDVRAEVNIAGLTPKEIGEIEKSIRRIKGVKGAVLIPF